MLLLTGIQAAGKSTAAAADSYFGAGFTVIVQDVILGEHLAEMVIAIRSRPLLSVVLAPVPPPSPPARPAGTGRRLL